MYVISCVMHSPPFISFFFFFNDTATTEIYTLSLHDALPISSVTRACFWSAAKRRLATPAAVPIKQMAATRFEFGKRSEEHTSELQSQSNLVCRLLLEKKKKKHKPITQ